jgi:hypothetical protein
MSNTATEETGPQPVGALEVLARDPSERKKFLKMVGKGVGSAAAATSLAAFIAACGSSSSSKSTSTPATATPATASTNPFGAGDIGIFNYALTLEYLETEFYKKVIKSGLFSGKVLDLLKSFGAQEQTHVDAIKAAIKSHGGTPATKPVGKFTLDNATNVAKLAATVENLGAAAYLGQAGLIVDKKLLASALAIHTVEARHAAILNTLTKQDITPDGAFAKPMTLTEVVAAVKPFIS